MSRRTPLETAEAIIQRAAMGYHDQKASGYPPYALTPWDDRIRWSNYLKMVIVEVLAEGK